MPGIVVSVLVKENDTITAGQTVAVIEAMKMENNIASPVSGIVGSIGVQPGKEVELGQILISLAQNSATKKSEDAGAIKIKGAA
jgi:biotin carboxyl carrier protein